MRVQFAGAIYHVMSRGDRREKISLEDVDRQDFLTTLAETKSANGKLHQWMKNQDVAFESQ
jgi:hypothetical protein